MVSLKAGSKPKIIIISPIDSDVCNWLSSGWHAVEKSHLPESISLKNKAHTAIESADNIVDAIKNLETAGFEVEHSPLP